MGRRQLFAIVVAANQLVASLLFAPWIRPRETVCGLMGRWQSYPGFKGRLSRRMGPILEVVFHKHETCREIYDKEERARGILYE